MRDPSDWVKKDDKYETRQHHYQRAKNGFSTYDWWNFCDYIAWVNIQALEKFKTGAGHPGDLNSMEEWVAELDIMIDGFKAHLEMQNNWRESTVAECQQRYEKGMALYTKRLPSLWD